MLKPRDDELKQLLSELYEELEVRLWQRDLQKVALRQIWEGVGEETRKLLPVMRECRFRISPLTYTSQANDSPVLHLHYKGSSPLTKPEHQADLEKLLRATHAITRVTQVAIVCGNELDSVTIHIAEMRADASPNRFCLWRVEA